MKNQGFCPGFKRDPERYRDGDVKDCNVCYFNNHATDNCMIGDET